MRGSFLRMGLRAGTMANFNAAELLRLRLRHAGRNSRARGGCAGRHNNLQRRSSFDEHQGAAVKIGFGAHHGLQHEIGNVNGGEGHRNAVGKETCPILTSLMNRFRRG